jgi:hypothetical protein
MPDDFPCCGGMPVCSVRDHRTGTGVAALNDIGADIAKSAHAAKDAAKPSAGVPHAPGAFALEAGHVIDLIERPDSEAAEVGAECAASMCQIPSPCPSRARIRAPVCGIRNHGK